MSEYIKTDENNLKNLADAIREKAGTTELMTVDEMSEAIKSIKQPYGLQMIALENNKFKAIYYGDVAMPSLQDNVTQVELIGVKIIPQFFANPPMIEEIELPENVTIEKQAFQSIMYGSSEFVKIFIPKTTHFESVSTYSEAPFYGCKSLEIYTDANEAPVNWGTYWNFKNNTQTLTVHYGVTREIYREI